MRHGHLSHSCAFPGQGQGHGQGYKLNLRVAGCGRAGVALLCRRAEDEAGARQEATEKLEALQALVAKAAADLGLAAGPSPGAEHAMYRAPRRSRLCAAAATCLRICTSECTKLPRGSRALLSTEQMQLCAEK